MEKMENISKVIIIDKDSISEIVQNAVNIAFQTFLSHYGELKEPPLRETDDITDVKGIAAFTHYSIPTIYTYAQQNLIPYYRQAGGRKLSFSKKEVLAWIKSNRSATRDEIAAKARSIKIKSKNN